MDFDFALILTVAVGITGVIWVLDKVLLQKRRMELAGAADVEVLANGTDSGRPFWIEYSASFFPVLLLVLLLRSFLIEPYQIPSGSMIPTLKVGDFILVNKYTYGLRLPVIGTKILSINEPQRGDVMVFIPPHEPRYFIKRVIGLPGDVIEYRNKHLTINGKPAPQKLLAALPARHPVIEIVEEDIDGAVHQIRHELRAASLSDRWVVPEGQYFMMGDNRDNSEDSRAWGFATEDKIVGRAVAVWLHKEPGWHLPTFNHNGAIE